MTSTSAPDLSALLRRLATAYGRQLAVAGQDDALTFTALDARADAWAAALARAGCGAGTHVALLAGNGPEWLAVAFGIWRAGATLVPISTFVTQRELQQVLEHADADVLVLEPQVASHNHLAAACTLAPLPRLRQLVVLGNAAPCSAALPVSTSQELVRDAQIPHAVNIDPHNAACILYTSGTTGRPKGVLLSHRAILATVGATAERTALAASDSLLSTLPLFWVAGLVIRALPTLATGCSLLLVETFTVERVIAALQRHRPTALHLRPPQVAQLLTHPQCEPALLAAIRRGGGRTEWFAGLLPPDARFITGYGMTETAGYVTALDCRDADEAQCSGLGSPLPGVTLQITDAAGRILPVGNAGEVRVRSPGMFSGYYKEPPGSGLDPDGWLMTGDLGRLDVDGSFHFSGRNKDLLRVKGINVSPVEVETVLGAHPAVEAAYVVGVPADALEQRVVALIVLKPGRTHAVETELRTLATESLSHYKRPQTYMFIDRADVPLGGTAKPQRAQLTTLAAKRCEQP